MGYLFAFLVLFAWLAWRERNKANVLQQKLDELEFDKQEEEKHRFSDTLQLIKHLLDNLNCRYEAKEEGRVEFSFHGDDYYILYTDDGVWCRIVEYVWYECSLDSVEEFSCMQKAINNVNFKRMSTACYSIDKENNKMDVFSKNDIILLQSLPSVENYFQICLNDICELKQKVVIEFEKEKQKIGIE